MNYPGATFIPGPPDKINRYDNSGYVPLTGIGAVLHSSEGTLNGALIQLRSTVKVSWHFTIDLNGKVYQHYDTTIECWHAHEWANANLLGIEFPNLYTDGKPDHRPLTAEQVTAAVALLAWYFKLRNLKASRDMPGRTLWEHHEADPNPTECPSGRVPWPLILAGLNPPPPRVWLYGDEKAGRELTGNVQVEWNNHVMVNLIGSPDGARPGETWHNEGGVWIKKWP